MKISIANRHVNLDMCQTWKYIHLRKIQEYIVLDRENNSIEVLNLYLQEIKLSIANRRNLSRHVTNVEIYYIADEFWNTYIVLDRKNSTFTI